MLTILVTGAAGLIGGEVCARLAERGHRVIALVHRTREVRGNDGRVVAGVQVVAGDVRTPLLGIDPASLPCDVVVHCAAALDFDAPEAVLAQVNVAGTANALAFAKAAGAAFLHVSTAYVCGLDEGPIAEAPVPAGRRFANNYEASKAAAETVVRDGGGRFAIARPSIVLGEHAHGAIREFPSLCNVFRLMARGMVPVFPAAPGATLNLVPICHVAGGIAALAERMAGANGGTFHLVAPEAMPARALADGVARVAHFPAPRVVEPAAYCCEAMPVSQQRVAGRMLATFGGYFTRNPRFDDRALRSATGLICPPSDEAWLDRLIAYGIASGYLPGAARDTSAHPDNNVPAARARPAPTTARP